MIDNLQDLFEPFQAFIRHNQYAMIVTDADFLITSFNKRAEEMLGYAEHEVIGRRSLLLWHDHDQLRDRAQLYSDKLRRTITPDEAVLFVQSHKGFLPNWEWIWLNQEGSRMMVSLNTSVMRYPDGTIKGYVLIARDVSEIKATVETNTRLLEIMESAHDMIASFDLRGRIFYLNQAGHSILGIESLNEHNNRLSQYMPIPTTVRLADGLTEAQKCGYWLSEIEIVSTKGTIQTASITVVAHLNDHERDTFFSTIIRDVSEQKEIQRQLVRAKDEADEANEAKSSFLARMSHEIRTPLNGIIGLTYLLQRSELTEIQADYLRKVSDSSQNLLTILNDILDFSKLEADKLSLEQVPFRIDESIQRLSGIFSVLLGSKPVDFILNIDPLIPDWLIGDPTRLEQVILNLVSNAIKFTNFGLIELSITQVGIENDLARLSFRIADTGIGMTDQQRNQLFRPFVQADEKTNRKYGGTGLGLVITQTLIELMGGSIAVESTHHVGSTFSFELSFPVDNTKTIPEHADDLGLSIIVLEDQEQVAAHWHRVLTNLGCEAVTLSSWQHAISLLDERNWDLVIVDMEAGDMHGEETWIKWKTHLDAYGIKVISATTLLGRDALQQFPDVYKPAAVIIKPASSNQIRQALTVVSSASEGQLQTVNHEADKVHDKKISQKASQRQHRIMVVDDQIINRIVMKELLEQQGFEVLLMESGLMAVEALQLLHVDLVLMDLHMPDMDGIEATYRIRCQYHSEQLPIIALTADVTEERHSKCMNAGMNDIITKPIAPEILVAILAKWLPASQPSLQTYTATTAAASEYWPNTPSFNASLGLQRLDGKSKLYIQLLDKFYQQYSDTDIRLTAYLKDSNQQDAIRLVHSLSGAAGHLGAIGIQETASLMERALQDQRSIPEAQVKLLATLREGMESIHNLLEQKRS